MQADFASKQADAALKLKQIPWETPRNIAIIVGVVAALTTAIAGSAGYRIGQQSTAPQQVQIVFPPGTTITVPPAPAPQK